MQIQRPFRIWWTFGLGWRMFLDERTPAERLCLCLLPWESQRYERHKGSKDLQLNSCRVQLSGWHWHTASLPQYCGMSHACTPYQSPGSHTFLYFSAFYLQIILANFNYVVSAMMLAPLGFLYVMCSSKMQKILIYACFIRLYHACTCNWTGS